MKNFIKGFGLAYECYPKFSQLRKRANLLFKLHFIFPSLTREIETFFKTNEIRSSIFKLPEFRANIYKQQTHRSLFRNSTYKERLNHLNDHFTFLEKTHSHYGIKKIHYVEQPPVFVSNNENKLGINLSFKTHIIREGFLSLTIQQNDSVLCRLTFWFASINGQSTICIGSLQGKRNALAEFKGFTKTFYGIRPQNMALIALRIYAKALGINQILTFPKERLYSKSISNDSCLDSLWFEQGAVGVANTPFIKLSSNTIRKPLHEIEAKKRSLYKKRYAFLDELDHKLYSYFCTHLLHQNFDTGTPPILDAYVPELHSVPSKSIL